MKKIIAITLILSLVFIIGCVEEELDNTLTENESDIPIAGQAIKIQKPALYKSNIEIKKPAIYESELGVLEYEHQTYELPLDKFVRGIAYVTCDEKRNNCLSSCKDSICKKFCYKSYKECLGKELTGIHIIDDNRNFIWVRNKLLGITSGSEIVKKSSLTYSPSLSPQEKKDVFESLEGWDQLEELDQLFLIQLTHSLHLEENNLVPWSLLEYSKEEIISLFTSDSRDTVLEFYQAGYTSDRSEFDKFKGDQLPLDMLKDTENLYILSKNVIGDEVTHYESIVKVVDWIERNFVHASNINNPESVPSDDPLVINYTRGDHGYIKGIFKTRSPNGCGGGTALLRGMLRSLNIPAYELIAQSHGVVFMPTINRYVHGDTLLGYSVTVPADYFILTLEEAFDGDDVDFYTEATYIAQSLLSDPEVRYLRFASGPFVSWPNKTMFIRFSKQYMDTEISYYPNGEEEWQEIRDRLPEYNLPEDHKDLIDDPYDERSYRSIPVPIKSLEELGGWE